MMKELLCFIYAVYKQSNESNELAYSSAISCLGLIRIAIFFPMVYFCVALIHPVLLVIVCIPYLIITRIYSKRRAPKKENCISNKRYYHARCPRLLMFVILLLFELLGLLGAALVGKYIIDPYGLEGWLLRFFH